MSARLPLVGRADLLRWMDASGEASLSASAVFLNYHKQETGQVQRENAGWLSIRHTDNLAQGVTPKTQQQEVRSAGASRPAEAFYCLEARTASAKRDGDDDPQGHWPEWLKTSEPLTEAELYPEAVEPPLGWQPLVPDNRLSPFLRAALSEWQARRLDVRRLVRQVAELHPLYRLPKMTHQLPAGRVCILVDCNRRVRPFWQDFHALCDTISRRHGRVGLEIRQLEDDANPLGAYSDWFEDEASPLPWVMPAANSVVLILSDAGLLAAANSPIRQVWKHGGRQFAQRGIRPVVLAPVAAVHLRAEMQALFQIVPWDRGKRLQEQRPTAYDRQRESACQRLLALLACAVHVEPELLRAIARLLPAQQADTGLEAEIWLHPHVVAGQQALAIHPARRGYYQALFSREPADLQEKVLRLLRQHHAGQFRGVWMSEVIQAEPLVRFPLQRVADAGEARGFMQRVVCTFHEMGMDAGMRQYAHTELERLPASLKARYQYPSVLFAQANQAALRRGALIPAEYDASLVQALVCQRLESATYTLWQAGENLHLRAGSPVSADGLRCGSPLAEVRVGSDTLQVLAGGQRRTVPLRVGQTLCRLPQPAGKVELDTGLERLVFSPLVKPAWAELVGRDGNGLFVECFWAGKKHRAYWKQAATSVLEQWEGLPFGEDGYGLYADLDIAGIPQRFRWIEPGTFTMGSPPDEAGREPHELLKGAETQHTVTLTQGFWLADTAVTQSQWQAVMGNNPSHFNGVVEVNKKSMFIDGANHPVEKVSWEDTQQFIGQLQALMPGLDARLPTDAQWEYACRAGTTTMFNFAGDISLEKVNFGGYFDKAVYAEKARQATVAVKSYPPNAWGLYEMHGNVWEWCQDGWQQEMSSEPTTDPGGSEAGVERVVRGGSWFDLGRDVRSAIRYRLEPDFRLNLLGFRLALGHAELQSGQQGGGAAKPAGADGTAPDRRERDAATGRGSVGSGGLVQLKDDPYYNKEMMEWLESTRSPVGLSADDLDKPSLAERVVDGVKVLTGWFGKKK